MAPSLRYLVVRALLFAVPFAVLMVAQVPWWLALIVAIAFAFAASIVFFPKLRDEAAADLQRMRASRARERSSTDSDAEDAAIGDEAVHPRDADADDPDASARP